MHGFLTSEFDFRFWLDMEKKTFLFLTFLLLTVTAFSQVSIFFDIRNERFVNHASLGNAVAFDVCMQASVAGTYHSRGQVYITYNEQKFGQDVVDRGKVIVEAGTLVGGTLNFAGTLTPLYTTVNVIDNAATIFAITWQSNFLNLFPHPLIHTTVPDTATVLYTIYMSVQNASYPNGIDINRRLMANQMYMITSHDNDSNGIPDEQPYANGFLPVEYMGFDHKVREDKTIELNWITSKEINNDVFVIEKDMGEGNFTPIGNIKGAGNSDKPLYYQFVDETQLQDVNYYRIKQIDLNGDFAFSPIIEATFSGGNLFQVYPTVTHDFCTLKATGRLEPSYSVQIFDVMGNILANTEMELNSEEGKLQLDLSAFNTGMYFIQVFTEAGPIYAAKVLKVQP